MKLPLPLFGGDKKDDNAKKVAAEKIVKYRAICMAPDVSQRNSSAAVPAVQSDPKKTSEATRISGGDRGDERDGKAKNRRRQEKIVIYRTIRMGFGPDASNARIAVPAVQSDRRSKRGAPNQRQRRGGDKTKNRRHRENREVFLTIRTVLGIGTGNSSAPWFQSRRQIEVPREALCWGRNATQIAKIQGRTSTGVFIFIELT